MSGNLRTIPWTFGIESREMLSYSAVQMVHNFCEGRGLTVSLESSDRLMSVCAAWRYPSSQTGGVMLRLTLSSRENSECDVSGQSQRMAEYLLGTHQQVRGALTMSVSA